MAQLQTASPVTADVARSNKKQPGPDNVWQLHPALFEWDFTFFRTDRQTSRGKAGIMTHICNSKLGKTNKQANWNLRPSSAEGQPGVHYTLPQGYGGEETRSCRERKKKKGNSPLIRIPLNSQKACWVSPLVLTHPLRKRLPQ